MRRIGVGLAAVALVAAVAGCGSGGDEGGESLPGKSESPSGPQVSGIVVLDKAPPGGGAEGDRSWSIKTYDPDSGKNTLSLSMHVGGVLDDPLDLAPYPDPVRIAARDRAHFSSDWRYAAFAAKDGIHILRLDAQSHSYVPKTTVKPPKGSYSGGEVTYYTPQFAPRGDRLWFEARPADGPRKLVSVDASSPRKPRAEAKLPGEESGGGWITWRVLPDGTAASIVHTSGSYGSKLYGPDGKRARSAQVGNATVRYLMADDQVVYGDLTVDTAGGFTSGPPHYGFVGMVDEQTMLLRVSNDPAEKYGPTVTVHVDPEKDKATVEPVAKGGAGSLNGVALAPDKKRVLLATSAGWFVKKLGSSAEPQPLRKPVEREPSATGIKPAVIGWTK